MPIKLDTLPVVSRDLVEALEKQFPVVLSKKEDDDFDRGVAWGKQEVISFLKTVNKKQLAKKLS